jgi:hypothetical protein
MPDTATGITGALSLGGSLISSGSDSGGSTSSQNSTSSYEYQPQWTDEEMAAIFSKIAGKINKSWMSGNRQTSSTLASRGLGGGVLASGIAGNSRARNESLSSAATDVATEGNKKLTSRITSSGTGTNTAKEGGLASNLGNTMSDIGGTLLSSKLSKWLSD